MRRKERKSFSPLSFFCSHTPLPLLSLSLSFLSPFLPLSSLSLSLPPFFLFSTLHHQRAYRLQGNARPSAGRRPQRESAGGRQGGPRGPLLRRCRRAAAGRRSLRGSFLFFFSDTGLWKQRQRVFLFLFYFCLSTGKAATPGFGNDRIRQPQVRRSKRQQRQQQHHQQRSLFALRRGLLRGGLGRRRRHGPRIRGRARSPSFVVVERAGLGETRTSRNALSRKVPVFHFFFFSLPYPRLRAAPSADAALTRSASSSARGRRGSARREALRPGRLTLAALAERARPFRRRIGRARRQNSRQAPPRKARRGCFGICCFCFLSGGCSRLRRGRGRRREGVHRCGGRGRRHVPIGPCSAAVRTQQPEFAPRVVESCEESAGGSGGGGPGGRGRRRGGGRGGGGSGGGCGSGSGEGGQGESGSQCESAGRRLADSFFFFCCCCCFFPGFLFCLGSRRPDVLADDGGRQRPAGSSGCGGGSVLRSSRKRPLFARRCCCSGPAFCPLLFFSARGPSRRPSACSCDCGGSPAAAAAERGQRPRPRRDGDAAQGSREKPFGRRRRRRRRDV